MTKIEFTQYQKLVKTLPVGKQLPDAVYIHASAFTRIPKPLAALTLQMAELLKIPDKAWNLVKFSKRRFKITFLNYPRFEEYAYPELQYSYTVDLQRLSVRKANYENSDNPPILHRKETFVSEDYPLYALFQEITAEAEEAGLYEKSRNIGFKKNWERLINTKGGFLDESGRLHRKEDLATQSPYTAVVVSNIERHKTAIDRNKLSAPMQTLAKHGYFDGNHSVPDYGCGKGDDIRELEAHGIDVSGWDPIHKPEEKLTKSDIVNPSFYYRGHWR